MSKARDMINAHLYPVLAVVSVVYFGFQIAPLAKEARLKNRCYDAMWEYFAKDSPSKPKKLMLSQGVNFCNGAKY